jgi:hypothetical protein
MRALCSHPDENRSGLESDTSPLNFRRRNAAMESLERVSETKLHYTPVSLNRDEVGEVRRGR